ncbi:MAG: FAD-binding oxidoreductase [Spirochaetales bacterium]|nr:FAD-binding oxidoreductase [Spirochaetales bacterium]
MATLARLYDIFGDDIIVRGETREDRRKELVKYSHDQVGDERYWCEPAAVVFPTRTEQVAELMKWANATGTAITPRGAGSGLAGAAIPVADGVVCSLEKMNRIVEIDADNLMVVVEPGVVTNALDAALTSYGLFFAGYPMSEDICFVGGNVAENAGGGRAVKYGTTSAYVIGAEVVTPRGEVLRLGGKRLKDVTGYNLLQLLIGSEGTLGIFTELTIRVIPRPAARGVFFGAFPTPEAATGCIVDLKQRLPDGPSAIEFIDGETARRTNESLPRRDRSQLPDDAEAFLLVEFDGPDNDTVERLLTAATDLVTSRGGAVDVSGTDDAAIERSWRLRKQVAWWVKRSAGQWHSLEDVVVPPAAVPNLVSYVGGLRVEHSVPIAVFGHAGDGNFHVTPMKGESMTPAEWDATAYRLLSDLYREVARLGGTISGEHGIGRKRVKYLSAALAPPELEVMRAIKRSMDPNDILNPGVIFPPA